MEVLGFDFPAITVFLGVFLVWLVRYAFFGFDYFEKKGVPTVQPVRPLVGNLWNIWKMDHRINEVEQLKRYGPTFGKFEGKNPVFYTADPELIKAITVKELDSFVDRRFLMPDSKYVRKMLSVLKAQEWKDVRSATSPVFSSGKIKKMSALMEECCKSMIRTARKRAQTGKGTVEMKELFGSYALDIIATCAFGTKIDDLDNPDNEFVAMSAKFNRPPALRSPILLIPLMFPWVVTSLGFKVFPDSTVFFYARIVENIIKTRRGEKQKRGDALDVLIEEMDAEKRALEKDPSRKSVITEEVVVAQCVIFFLAGFDTTGTLLTFATYYLALNPGCQQKLFEEISAQKAKHEGKICHEMLLDCPYLDQVVTETLRIAPPAMRFERLCTTSCEVGGIKFEKGDIVAVPVYAIHHMKENYPEPQKFDPERFSPENKHKIKPLTYLPFGNGPRNCIGMRFALEEAKLALASMVDEFKFDRCPETYVPMKVLPNNFLLQPPDVKLNIQERA